MLNRIVSPSCTLLKAITRFVSFGAGVTLLVVLTAIMAAWVTAQNRASVAVEKNNVGFFIRHTGCQLHVIPTPWPERFRCFRRARPLPGSQSTGALPGGTGHDPITMR